MRFTILLWAIFLAACTSPETSRSRGGGPGADLGNRGELVEMHEGAEPYYRTPRLVEAQPEPSESDQRQARLR
jgi:hypothetical protein